MEMVIFTLLSLPLIFAYLVFRRRNHEVNAPPGPTRYPIVGNLFQLGGEPAKTIGEWSRTIGQTLSVQMGARRIVVMHDAHTARSVFGNDNTTGRDPNFVFNHVFKNRGFVQSEGQVWKEQRRFALTTLRNLGMGKPWLENAILTEVQVFIDEMKQHKGQEVDVRPLLTASVSNVICELIFGRRFDYTDEKYLRLDGLLSESFKLTGLLLPLQAFPILKYIPFTKLTDILRNVHGNMQDIVEFCRELIGENSIVDTQRDATYLEAFLEKRRQLHAANIHDTSFSSDEQLTIAVANLFAAGTETITSTLLWSFIFLARFPEVQARIITEVHDNTDLDEPITMKSKGKLIYTQAALLDAQRLASVAPLGVPHTNFEVMTIDGYHVPARTLLHVNIASIHHNPQYWSHPNSWHPEHFLDENNHLFIPEAFLPFSVGKRACLGESLAKMELFIFFANIVKQFEVLGDPKTLEDAKSKKIGLMDSPLPFEIRLVSRSI